MGIAFIFKPSASNAASGHSGWPRFLTQPRGPLERKGLGTQQKRTVVLPPRFAQPRIEDASQAVHQGASRPWRDLHQIDILGIARRWRQVELIQRRTSPEGEGPDQDCIGEDLDQGTADDQILLYLEVFAPWRPLPPLGDVVPGITRPPRRPCSRTAASPSNAQHLRHPSSAGASCSS